MSEAKDLLDQPDLNSNLKEPLIDKGMYFNQTENFHKIAFLESINELNNIKLGKVEKNSITTLAQMEKGFEIDRHFHQGKKMIPKKKFTSIVLSSDGSIAYYGNSHGEVESLSIDMELGQELERKNSIFSLSGQKSCLKSSSVEPLKHGKIRDMVLSNDESILYCATKKRFIFRIKVQESQWVAEYIDKMFKGVSGISLSHDGKYLLAVSDDSAIRLYSIENENKDQSGEAKFPLFNYKMFIGFTLDIKCVAFTKDSSMFITGSIDGHMKIWETENNLYPKSSHKSKTGPIRRLILTGNDTYLVFGTYDGFISVWLFKEMTEYHNFYAHSHSVSILFSVSDSPYVISSSKDGQIKIFNIKDKFEENTIDSSVVYKQESRSQNELNQETASNSNEANTPRITSMKISNDSSFVLLVLEDTIKKIDIWKLKQENVIKCKLNYFPQKHSYLLRGHKDQVASLLWCPGTERLISGSNDSTIIIWEYKSVKKQLKGHTGCVRCFALNEAQTILFSGSHDKTIMKWTLDFKIDKYEGNKFGEHGDCVWAVKLFDRENKVASGSVDRSIIVWDAKNGAKISQVLEAHSLPITTLMIHDERNIMITTSLDSKLRIWDISSVQKQDPEAQRANLRTIKLNHYFKDSNEKKFKYAEPQCADFDKEKKFLVVGFRNSSIIIFNVENDLVNESINGGIVLKGHNSWIRSVKFVNLNAESNSYYIISVSYDRTMRLWKVENGEVVDKSIIEAHNEHILDVCIYENERKNEKYAVTSSAWKNIKVWKLNFEIDLSDSISYHSSKDDKNDSTTHQTSIKSFKIFNNFILTGSEDGILKIWEFEKESTQFNNVKLLKVITNLNCAVTHMEKLNDSALIIALKDGSFYKLNLNITENELYERLHFCRSGQIGSMLCHQSKFVLCTDISSKEIFLYDLNSRKLSDPAEEPARQRQFFTTNSDTSIKVSITCMISDQLEFDVPDSNQMSPIITQNVVHNFYAASIDRGIHLLQVASSSDSSNYSIRLENDKIAEELEGIMKICLVFRDLIACALRDYSIVLWRLGRNYKYRVFKGHNERITDICALDSRFYPSEFISCSRDMTIRRWNVEQRRQVFIYTGHSNAVNCVGSKDSTVWSISDDKTLRHWNSESEMPNSISEFSSTMENFLFFYRFQKKRLPDIKLINSKFGVYNHTPLHYYMYHGYNKLVEQALSLGAEIYKNKANKSPLAYAINIESQTHSQLEMATFKSLSLTKMASKEAKQLSEVSQGLTARGNREKCIDYFLSYMIDLRKVDEEKFVVNCCALEDDFIELIRHNSVFIPEFFENLLITCMDTDMPRFAESKNFPLIDTSPEDMVSENKVNELKRAENGELIVPIELKQIPFKVPLIIGSSESKKMLRNLLETNNQAIYGTPIVQFIIKSKWRKLWPLVFAICMLSWLNFFYMTMLLFNKESFTWTILFFLNTSVLLTVEIYQMFCSETFISYFDFWNCIDLFRIFLCYFWLCLLVTVGVEEYIFATWLMVLSNVMRGISGFRCISMTRYYIKLLGYAVKDTYSFIIIFLFSTLGFGILYLESSNTIKSDNIFEVIWKTPYELNMGAFTTTNELLPYTTFMIASLVNVIMMLNLLISILGDSYDKFQANAIELDTRAMAEVILELEEFFTWQDSRVDKNFINVIDVLNTNKMQTWEGKIKEIEKIVKVGGKDLKLSIAKLAANIDKYSKSFKDIEDRLQDMKEASDKRAKNIFDEINKIAKPK